MTLVYHALEYYKVHVCLGVLCVCVWNRLVHAYILTYVFDFFNTLKTLSYHNTNFAVAGGTAVAAAAPPVTTKLVSW